MSVPQPDWRFTAGRPSITPLFAFGSTYWGACAGAYAMARTADISTCQVASVTALAAAAVAALVAFAFGRRSAHVCGHVGALAAAALVAAAAGLGIASGLGQAALLHAIASDASSFGGESVRVELLEDSSETTGGERALARIQAGGRQATAAVLFPDGAERRYGQALVARVDVGPVDERSGEYWWRRGAVLQATARDAQAAQAPALRAFLVAARSRAIDYLGASSRGGGLLQAVVCGYRRNIRGTAEYADFQACGLAHLVAVSGAHLVIVTGLLARALRALRVPRGASAAVLALGMGSYLVFSGAPVSAVRAVAMSCVGAFSFAGARRPSSLNALGVGMIAIVASSPASSVSLSFALSALSTAGIVMFSPLVSAWLAKTPLGRAPLIAEPLALTFSAALLSQPLACAAFDVLPLASPLANVACTAVFPLLCAGGLLAALIGALGAPVIVASAAGLPAAVLLRMVAAFARLPYACVPATLPATGAIALAVVSTAVLWALWDRGPLRALAGLACVLGVAGALFAPNAGGDRIVMLDVGQGDAFLLQSRGATLLVDTGNRDSQLLAGLAGNGVARIDAILITHADDDHCGSLDALERTVDVGTVIVAQGIPAQEDPKCSTLIAQASAMARSVQEVAVGDVLSVGAFRAHVLWPQRLEDAGGNADSICLLVEYDGDSDGLPDATALFTGDAEAEQLRVLMEDGVLGHVDLLKVGHHGSHNGMTADQAQVLSPEIALIGVGAGNRYGHPAGEVLQMLADVGCTVYRSDEDGEVRCSLSTEGVAVTAVK